MPKFRTPYEPLEHTLCSCGDEEREVMTLTYDDNHNKKLVKVDSYNISDYINSFADSVDLHSLINKVTQTGDVSYLQQRVDGIYADLSEMPKDRLEWAELVENNMAKVGKIYNSLDAESKSHFSGLRDFCDVLSSDEFWNSRPVVDVSNNSALDIPTPAKEAASV